MYKYGQVTAGDDQAYVAALCDRVEKSLDEGLLPVDVFNDDRVFRAEMDRIFTRTWVFVAHESEIPNSGDFVQRKIGLDGVIVTRNGKGEINVLLNHCRHYAYALGVIHGVSFATSRSHALGLIVLRAVDQRRNRVVMEALHNCC